MEWYKDSTACLYVAKELIEKIKSLSKESEKLDDNLPYIHVHIKNTLENCRSPLDYVANHLKKKFNPKGKGRIYFPIIYRDQKNPTKEGYVRLNNIFGSDCDILSPEYRLIERMALQGQSSIWISNLNKLVNSNKHKNLTKHKTYTLFHIENGTVESMGIQLENVSFGSIEDLDKSQLNYQEIEELFFDDIGFSVDVTLDQILKSVEMIIDSLYYIEKSQ